MPRNDDPRPRSEGKNAKKGKEIPYSSKHVRQKEAILANKKNTSSQPIKKK